jgi:predicted nucleic acid-binding protein
VLLLDAGVWIAAADPDDRYHSTARALVLTSSLSAMALDLTLYEVANVIGARKRHYDLAKRVCRSIPERCNGRLVRIDADTIADTVGIVAEHGLTAYDAAYVAAARRSGWTLVSTDIKDLVGRGLALAPDDPSIQPSEDG